eukprot:GHVS01102369.1.p1 GENE.GHVS01102369.1~~GHVS01102369.1.p1  ORF type:complete len:211 (+),score=41.96 GHVS01102369.1:127-759(+)
MTRTENEKEESALEGKVSGVTTEQINVELRKMIEAEKVHPLTPKQARVRLEEVLALPEGSMKERKEDIKMCMQKITDSLQEENNVSDEAEENTDEKKTKDGPAVKKQKVAEDVEEAPKDAAKIQAKLMTRCDFEKNADDVVCQLGPNKFCLEPRVFSANNKGQSNAGWGYYKKVKMPVGGRFVWCTVSMNVIVAGSRDWQDGDRTVGRSN